jgi:hypothetical protein
MLTGSEPLPNGLGQVARIYVTDGTLTLEQADAAGELKANPPPPPEPTVVGPDGKPVKGPAAAGKPPVKTGKQPDKNGVKPPKANAVAKYSDDQPRDEHGRWEGSGGGGGSSESSGGGGSESPHADDHNNASSTNAADDPDSNIQQLTPEEMKEVFGILADSHPIILHTGDAANLAEWDETLDHAAWEAPGDFESWRGAGNKAQLAEWFAEAMGVWLKKKALSKAGGPKVPPESARELSVDRPVLSKIEEALREKVKESLDKAKTTVLDEVEAALDASGDAARENMSSFLKFVDLLDLSDILNLHEPLIEGLEAILEDTVPRALASVGVNAASELVDQVSADAVAYARARAAELLSVDGDEGLIATTRQAVRDIIANGLENNIGKEGIVADLQESMAFSEARAQLIASTEVAMANADAKKQGWDAVVADGATLLKQWFASGEDGVCPECEANEDEGEIEYSEAFSSGDDMEPAHPACRCVVTARVVSEEGAADTGEEE